CARHVAPGLGLVSEDAGSRPPRYQLSGQWLRDVSRVLLDSPRSRALNGATDDRSRILAAFFVMAAYSRFPAATRAS
ncbi:MAG TPA: hypothetical protein VK821_11870, partial [Dehalococcoidia bacterium]|nr:hypothetical protein [Dehalococcoidia bacterium]